jgi:CheY-like chemotaxis protein
MARILVYQDSPAQRHILKKSLESRHQLFFAGSLSKTETLLKETALDLIIIRVHLEKNDVFTVVKALRNNKLCSQLPIICFCGKRTKTARQLDPVLEQATRAAGATGYLCIDTFCVDGEFKLEALRDSIENLLELSRANKEIRSQTS